MQCHSLRDDWWRSPTLCHARRATRAIGKRTAVALLVLLVSVAVTPRQGAGQTVTLPTIRTTGPLPEEAMLFRLIRVANAMYARDTLSAQARADTSRDALAADSLARRVLRRLDRLFLASLTAARLDDVAIAETREEKLELLAGDRFMPDDRVPEQSLAALERFLQHTAWREACSAWMPETVLRWKQDFGVTDDTARVTQNQQTRRRNLALFCVSEDIELGRRSVARLFGGLSFDEAESGNSDRVTILDSLARAATAVVVLRRVNDAWLFPVTNRDEAEAFWRQRGLAPLNVGSISGSGKAGVAFTELASPLLHAVRVSVNAVLAAETQDEDGEDPLTSAPSDATIQRFLTGGGLFNASFALPVTKHDWAAGDVGLLTLLVPRVGLTAPVLGAAGSDSSTINAELGLELHLKAVDFKDGVGFLAQFRGASTHGTRTFIESIGMPDKTSVQYLSASFGLLFGRQYLLTASRALMGPKVLRRAPWQIGLTVVRLPSGA